MCFMLPNSNINLDCLLGFDCLQMVFKVFMLPPLGRNSYGTTAIPVSATWHSIGCATWREKGENCVEENNTCNFDIYTCSVGQTRTLSSST